MTGQAAVAREPLTTYDALAKRIDHSLVAPELSEDQVRDGCYQASEYGVACAIVRPCDVDVAIRTLRGSGVRVGAVAGFPHGSSTTGAKLYEVRDLVRRGVAEIDTVINLGKLHSRQFRYLETELEQIATACREENVVVKVILESPGLPLDLKIIACRIAKRAAVDFVQTCTGFAANPCTAEDLRLLAEKCNPIAKVKAAGRIRTLEAALEMYNAGADRLGLTRTATILDAWKKQLAAAP